MRGSRLNPNVDFASFVAFQPQTQALCQTRGSILNPNANLASFVRRGGRVLASDTSLMPNTSVASQPKRGPRVLCQTWMLHSSLRRWPHAKREDRVSTQTRTSTQTGSQPVQCPTANADLNQSRVPTSNADLINNTMQGSLLCQTRWSYRPLRRRP